MTIWTLVDDECPESTLKATELRAFDAVVGTRSLLGLHTREATLGTQLLEGHGIIYNMLVDAHAHLDKYTEGLSEALHEMEKHKILTVSVAMDVQSFARTTEIARESAYVIPTFGVHPWEAHRYCKRLDEMDAYLEATPIIGEAGLDFHWVEDKSRYLCQVAVFEYQCGWAARLQKPMNLHTKGAEGEVLEAIRKFHVVNPVIHWYSGPMDLVDSYLDEGSYFTVGVEVLTSQHIQAIAAKIPESRLLLETDNPGGYEWFTKKKGMPSVLLDVLRVTARLRETDPRQLENQLWKNWTVLTSGVKGIPTA